LIYQAWEADIRTDVGNVLNELSKKSGLGRAVLRERFHRIKAKSDSPDPTDQLTIDDKSGDVFDAQGQYAGNVFNDF